MNKIKLLMPILGISTIAATAIPLASCNNGTAEKEITSDDFRSIYKGYSDAFQKSSNKYLSEQVSESNGWIIKAKGGDKIVNDPGKTEIVTGEQEYEEGVLIRVCSISLKAADDTAISELPAAGGDDLEYSYFITMLDSWYNFFSEKFYQKGTDLTVTMEGRTGTEGEGMKRSFTFNDKGYLTHFYSLDPTSTKEYEVELNFVYKD